jgi:hypothetical protein
MRPNLDRKGEGPDDLAEECSLFVLGFGEGNSDLRAKKGYGEAGEAGPGAKVKKGSGAGINLAGGKEALAKVAADDLLRVADGGEIGAGVPFEEKVEVKGELGEEAGWDVRQIRSEEICYCGF